MKMMANSYLVIALGVLMMAGCASTGEGPAQSSQKTAASQPKPTTTVTPKPTAAPVATPSATPPPAEGQGTIVFFRESKFAGAAVSFKVRESGKELGKLSSGTYFTLQVPAGKHQFEVHSEAKDILTLEVEPGETYYVIGTISMGVLVGHPNLSPSSATTFDSMKAKLKDSAKG
jgi:hypothetical protein